MTLTSGEWWTMATTAACGAACGLVGCFLVLRRMSMLGDAISHAILPGLAGAFLITGTRDVWAMLAGAMVVGVFTAGLSAGLARWGKVPEDAAMGVVFSSLFALGVLLISKAADQVDLDPGCVLYGALEGVSLDTLSVAGANAPRALVVLVVALCVNLLLTGLFAKEIKLVSFDSALAASMGIPVAIIHYGMMSLVAATSVVSFEAVGSILVVALLVGPPASAHLLTDRYGRTLALSVLLGVVAACAGTVAAVRLDVSIAGAISVAVGVVFLLAALLSPRHGVLVKSWRRVMLAVRIRAEDLLGTLYRAEQEKRTILPTPRVLSAGIVGRWAARQLRRQGLLVDGQSGPALSPKGVAAARQVLRAHRMWESYLAREWNVPLDHLHEPSERMEHFVTERLARGLTETLDAREDPQGRPIPPAGEGSA